jgi:hypothetical protein
VIQRGQIVTLTVGRPLPVHPDQRTFLWFVGMCQRCQQRKRRSADIAGNSAPAQDALDRGTFSTIFCSRRRRFVAAPYPTDDGNDDQGYRTKRTHCGEAAARALARTQYSEQKENTACRSVDPIEAVAEAPILRKKAPSSFLCSPHRAISRVDEPLAHAAALDWFFRARVLEWLPAHRLRARSDGIMIGCGPILGKELSAAHPSRISDWASNSRPDKSSIIGAHKAVRVDGCGIAGFRPSF